MNCSTRATVTIICLFLCLSYSAHANTNGSTEEDTILLESPVKVYSRLNKDLYEDGQHYYYPFEIRVDYGKQHYSFTTITTTGKDLKAALRHLKKTATWEKPYLYVRSECGGGNAWRCNIYHVFKLNMHNLLYMGMAFKTERIPAAKGRIFLDIFDKFENNFLTSHAGAPAMLIVLSDKNDRLVTDLKRTWARNKKEHSKNSAKIRHIVDNKPDNASKRWQHDLAVLLLTNAVRAKYCEQTTELENIMSLSETYLDKEMFENLKDSVLEVIPGELPQANYEMHIVTSDQQ